MTEEEGERVASRVTAFSVAIVVVGVIIVVGKELIDAASGVGEGEVEKFMGIFIMDSGDSVVVSILLIIKLRLLLLSLLLLSLEFPIKCSIKAGELLGVKGGKTFIFTVDVSASAE